MMTRVRHFTAQRSSDTYHSNGNENRDKLRKIKSSPCSFLLHDALCGVWPCQAGGRGQRFPLPNTHESHWEEARGGFERLTLAEQAPEMV